MNKTREEFEKTISGFYVKKCVENGTMEQAFYDNQFEVFKDGRQSRDKEIKIMRDALKVVLNNHKFLNTLCNMAGVHRYTQMFDTVNKALEVTK